GLRKISQHAAGYRIELLGKQTDIVAAREKTIEQLPRFRITPLHYVISTSQKLHARNAPSPLAGHRRRRLFHSAAQIRRGSGACSQWREAFPAPSDRWRVESRPGDQQQAGRAG